MTLVLSKKEIREERRIEKAIKVRRELEDAVISFSAKIHKMLQEPIGGAIASFHPPDPSRKVGKPIRPFVTGEVIEPLKPIKLPKGVDTLVIEDDNRLFKEPIISPKMQKNLRILELRLDDKGHLYTPKSFDPTWHWQTQAIWFRLIGLGYADIAKKVKKSLNTIKSMFKRLGISSYFPRISKKDYATIGYGAKNTPSGWRIILYGGSSGILYPSSEMVIDERSGINRPLYILKSNLGETISEEKPFDFKQHKRGVKKRAKEEKKRKIEVTTEQKTIEIENLMKHIEGGFDPETGVYDD